MHVLSDRSQNGFFDPVGAGKRPSCPHPSPGESMGTLYTLPRSSPVATCIADSEMPRLPVDTTTMEATTAVPDIDALCARIADVIADHTDSDPLAMTPLATVLDPEALDALVRTGTDVQVSFTYEDHLVEVYGDETISVDGEEYDSLSADGDG